MGKSYLGILNGFESSAKNLDKPPLDTGVYLKSIADGDFVNPPMSRNVVSNTSWPEGHLSGFMNFHIPGLIFFSFLSGLLLGIFFKLLVVSQYSYGAIFLFSIFSYMGAPNLSPFGVVRILTFIGIFLFFWLFSFFFNLISGIKLFPKIK
jgi:hypothetical protein